jgi:dihydrofolate reductase
VSGVSGVSGTVPGLTLIAALAENGVIGKDGGLPWRLSADLRRFKALTTGHTVLMGRKTFESLGRPLPNRVNRVLTRNSDWKAAGCEVFHDLQAALTALPVGRLIVIGGAELYRQTLPFAECMELTQVAGAIEGDACFPSWNPADWLEAAIESHPADDRNERAFRFVSLVRKPGSAYRC